MRYIRQFGTIMLISFLGEILNAVIPLTIPASIYGIVLMFVCLCTRVIPLSAVKETGDFLTSMLPLIFLPATVGILNVWNTVKPMLLPYLVIVVVSTFVVMACSGILAQRVIRGGKMKARKQ